MAGRAWLGVDYGEKRIGVAIASDDEPAARPLETIDGNDRGLGRLAQLIAEHTISAIILGLPRNLDGDDTAQTKTVRDDIAVAYEQSLGLPVYLQDEAVTSELARDRLISRGESLDGGSIDREAATIILQDYLDAQR